MPKRQMLINYAPGEECRIAIVEDGQLEELYQERASAESHVGNIYKGRVTNVEPSIQAAFIDFGLDRNGFLHISDLHPMYFPGEDREEFERVGKKTPRRDRPPIQKCLQRGKEILVQVLKEGIGTKGPTLTSYLSIPGRFLVMMPNMERLGVSRKIEDDDARREMRKVLDSLDPPANFGFIIRTAGIGRTKAELKRDLSYLQRLWKTLDQRRGSVKVGELYTESDLVVRTIRDVFSTDIESIIVDHPHAAKRARDFLRIIHPRAGSRVLAYHEPIPLFHRFDIERQIEGINNPVVPLASGGSLVIDSTEALVAIDVNSGKSRDNRDAETTAYKTNMEAADEICRQLRLRDLGGVVVSDLIDMRQLKYRRAVEQRFKENLKRDRARTRTAAISQFGILEMTRQRMRPSLKTSIYSDCRQCHGSGYVKSAESVVLDVMRRLALALYHENVVSVELTVSPDVAFQLLNKRRAQLVDLESRYDKRVMVRVKETGAIDYVELVGFDSRGSAVDAESVMNLPAPQLKTPEVAIADSEQEDLDADIEDGQVDSEGQVATDGQASGDDDNEPRRRRRRGGRGRRRKSQDSQQVPAPDETPPPSTPAKSDDAAEPQDEAENDAETEGEDGKKPRRRRRRRSRKKPASEASDAPQTADAPQTTGASESTNPPEATDEPPKDTGPSGNEEQSQSPKPRRRRRRRRKPAGEGNDEAASPSKGYGNRSVAAPESDQE
jgi:ribonuclease E